MGLTVTTDDKGVKVIRKDKDWNGKTLTFYSLMYASKDKDGNWHNGFIDCTFKKGVDIPNKTKIKIKNGFYVASEYNGKTYNKVMVIDYEIIGDAPAMNTDDFMNIPDGFQEELPFD